MASAKKAVDSTIRRVLTHMAEIIMSIVLLIIICIPLVFVIPMWLQQIALSSAVENLVINPVSWFGYAGAVGVTVLLSLVSLILGYFYLMGIAPRTAKAESIEEEEVKAEKPNEEEASDEGEAE